MRARLKSLRCNGDHRIAFVYEDHLVAELDFGRWVDDLHGPMGEPLQEEQFFSQAFIDHGVLTWPNGFDVCPDVLRFWCEEGRICTADETEAHFACAAAAS